MSIDVVRSAVADVLDVPPPDGSSNFLDLGGSSLAAVQVVARIERTTRVRLDPRAIVRSDTLDEIAALLTGADDVPRDEPVPAATARTFGRASLAQQWALDAARAEPDAPPLQFHVAYRVRGPLDVPALADALRAVVAHHPALHVVLTRRGDHDVMVIVAPDAALEVEDGEPDAAHERATAFVRAPFPATGGPRVRGLLRRTGRERAELCLAFDHRVADGWSLRVLLEDLGTAYAQRRAGAPVVLPPAGSYLDFAEAEQAAAADRIDRATRYWAAELPDAYRDFPVALPGRRGDGPLTGPRHQERRLPADVVDAVARARAATGGSAFAVVTAATARAVAGLTGSGRVRLLTSSANRDHSGHDRTVGWFANGVFPTYDVAGHPRGADLVAHVTRTAQAADAAGDVPAVHVRTGLWPDAPAGFRTDTGIYLAVNDSWSEPLVLDGCALEPVELTDRADAPGVQLHVLRDREGLVVHAFSHDSEYRPDVAAGLVDAVEQELRRLAAEKTDTA